jgi:hypothetical protein
LGPAWFAAIIVSALGFSKSADVTYTRDLAHVFFAKCTPCHRPDGAAPFSLMTYDDVRRRAETIKSVVLDRSMPPYKATSDYGRVTPASPLTDDEAVLIQEWIRAGMAKGNASDMPPSPEFAPPPKASIVLSQKGVTVRAEGPTYWQTFVIPADITKKRGLIGFSVAPANPSVIRSVTIGIDTAGKGRAEDVKTPEPGYETAASFEAQTEEYIGVWTIGNGPWRLPDGVGKTLKPGDNLLVQVQYRPNGTAADGNFDLGLTFASGAYREVRQMNLGTRDIKVPILETPNFSDEETLSQGIQVVGVIPEARDYTVEVRLTATPPTDPAKTILRVYPWNVTYIGSYMFSQPPVLPKGTKLTASIHYQNDLECHQNQNSYPRPVAYGPKITDELFWVRVLYVPAP